MQFCFWFKNLLIEDPSPNSSNFFQTRIFAIVFTVYGKLKFTCDLDLHNSYVK